MIVLVSYTIFALKLKLYLRISGLTIRLIYTIRLKCQNNGYGSLDRHNSC